MKINYEELAAKGMPPEAFAAEVLMPNQALRKQVALYEKNGYVDFDGVLKIADYFGVSFKACLNRLAYKSHKIEGDTSPIELDRKVRKYKPGSKRSQAGHHETVLYEQLMDAIGRLFDIVPSPFACQKFKNEYIYYDSRMEGVEIGQEEAAAIVTDLRTYKQESIYCTEKNKNIVEVAGLSLAYDYAFEEAETAINISDAKHLNEKLFSTAPYPELGGRYRETNTLVLGAKFETIPYWKIQEEMLRLDKEIQRVLDCADTMSNSAYIEAVIRIHHRLTVIHAFRDGNGRTSRAFLNMMLLKKHIPPVFFKAILISNAALSDYSF